MSLNPKAATASSTIPTPSRSDAPLALRKLDTLEAAERLRIKPQTIRRGLCINGHYLGLKPTRLPNGRLLWDASAIDDLLNGEGV